MTVANNLDKNAIPLKNHRLFAMKAIVEYWYIKLREVFF